jgi:hypothetical protein
MMAVLISTATYADKANVRLAPATVRVDEASGIVVVDISEERRWTAVPSNGAGLFNSGQIEDGQSVTVKIVQNGGRKYEFRGHVTVLK